MSEVGYNGPPTRNVAHPWSRPTSWRNSKAS